MDNLGSQTMTRNIYYPQVIYEQENYGTRLSWTKCRVLDSSSSDPVWYSMILRVVLLGGCVQTYYGRSLTSPCVRPDDRSRDENFP